MIKRSFLFFLTILCFSVTAQDAENTTATAVANNNDAETHFISDDLFIYMHTGPGTNYRILGSVTAGTSITVLNTDEGADYTQIQDNRGRTGWVKSEFVQQGQSIRVQHSNLATQLSSTQQADQQLNQTLTQLEMELVSAKDDNALLQEQISQLQKETSNLNQQLSVQSSESEKDWFVKGGMVSLGGVLFGVLLTLVLRRKKRSDGFYDRY